MVEGIYANTGDVAPLAAIAALKHKCACLPHLPYLGGQQIAWSACHLLQDGSPLLTSG